MLEIIVTAVITAVLSVLVGLILWRVQRERLSIEYDLIESDTVPREHGVVRYFVLKLWNSGNKPVQKLEMHYTFL